MTVLGMIGAGRWGSNWIKTLAHMPEVELRWVCDVSKESLARLQTQFPRVRTTTRLIDLLEDDSLNGLVIASSAPTHFEVASAALRAGKHVLVEKPMTLMAADALELTRLAQEKGRVLMVGHLLEYHPIVNRIKAMIDAGDLGEVLYLYSQRLNLGTIRADENAWWSLAPHDISVACRMLGGVPQSVQCRGTDLVRRGVADVVWSVLQFPDGRLAHMHVSWLDPHKTRKLTVVGSHKSAVFDDTADHKFVIHEKGFERSQGHAQESITLRQGTPVFLEVDNTEPLVLEARHFVDCIRHRRRPVSDGEAGAMVVSVLECGQRSLERGGEVIAIPPVSLSMRRSA